MSIWFVDSSFELSSRWLFFAFIEKRPRPKKIKKNVCFFPVLDWLYRRIYWFTVIRCTISSTNRTMDRYKPNWVAVFHNKRLDRDLIIRRCRVWRASNECFCVAWMSAGMPDDKWDSAIKRYFGLSISLDYLFFCAAIGRATYVDAISTEHLIQFSFGVCNSFAFVWIILITSTQPHREVHYRFSISLFAVVRFQREFTFSSSLFVHVQQPKRVNGTCKFYSI